MSKNVKKLITLCEGFLRDVRDLHAPCGPIRNYIYIQEGREPLVRLVGQSPRCPFRLNSKAMET